jgi:hypothetical protein
MLSPGRLPGLRWLTLLAAVLGVLWLAPEGDLGQTAGLALLFTLVTLRHLCPSPLTRRPASRWPLFAAAAGAGLGLLTAGLTLVLMAIKTGLHGHGPEYSPAEVIWVLHQAPRWLAAGAVAGLGLGMVAAGLRRAG